MRILDAKKLPLILNAVFRIRVFFGESVSRSGSGSKPKADQGHFHRFLLQNNIFAPIYFNYENRLTGVV